jgi:hypothetical protein
VVRGPEHWVTLCMGLCPASSASRVCAPRHTVADDASPSLNPPPTPLPLPQTPAEEDRAAPHQPKATFLYTGSNATAAARLSAGLLSPPSLTGPAILSAQRYLEAFGSQLGGDAVVPGAWVARVRQLWGGRGSCVGCVASHEPQG